jgi:hypothetical protein
VKPFTKRESTVLFYRCCVLKSGEKKRGSHGSRDFLKGTTVLPLLKIMWAVYPVKERNCSSFIT